MRQVAKLVVIDPGDQYLLLTRDHHPLFGDDADLPGGTGEIGESMLEIVKREVAEEIGVTIRDMIQVYEGLDYTEKQTMNGLYIARMTERPEIILSWEHSRYEWVSRHDFLVASQHARDDYMHMVYDVVRALKR